MKIATWNVNSVRQRIDHLCNWLRETSMDIVLLQEIKCLEETFPKEPIEDLGYNVVIFGQKTFNGVAILSKKPIEDVQRGLGEETDEGQARYIEAVIGNVRVASVYVPNGQEVGSDKYAYKMRFFEGLRKHMENLLRYEEVCVIGGDFNVAPDDQDVCDSKVWKDQILCSIPERLAFQSLLNVGYSDSMRCMKPGEFGPFTWWDYRAQSFERNLGLRIDHLLISPQAADCLIACEVDASLRGLEKASDHTPVWCQIGK